MNSQFMNCNKRTLIIIYICLHIGYAVGYRYGKARGQYISQRQLDGCVDENLNLRKLIK